METSALSACLLAARCFSSWTSLTSGHHHHHHHYHRHQHHQWTATIIKTFTITITTTIINTFIVDVFILFVIIVISIALLSSNQNRSSLMAGSLVRTLHCGQFWHSNYFHHHHHHHQNQLGEDGLLHLICWSCRREHLPVYVHWGQVRDPNLEKIIMFSQQVHQGQDWTSLVISCGEALATPEQTQNFFRKCMISLFS